MIPSMYMTWLFARLDSTRIYTSAFQEIVHEILCYMGPFIRWEPLSDEIRYQMKSFIRWNPLSDEILYQMRYFIRLNPLSYKKDPLSGEIIYQIKYSVKTDDFIRLDRLQNENRFLVSDETTLGGRTTKIKCRRGRRRSRTRRRRRHLLFSVHLLYALFGNNRNTGLKETLTDKSFLPLMAI